MRVRMEDLVSGYGAGAVVDGVDLDVASGEAVAVVGRNGMGKSTLVKTLLGYVSDVRGRVILDDTDVTRRSTHDIIRRGVAYAPQEAAVFANLSVRDNLFGAMRGHKPPEALRSLLFDTFPVLAGRLDQPAGTLSGGEQKLLLFTRCLLREPRVLVLDEISAGLQPSMVTAVETVLSTVRADRPMTVVMVEQNVDLCTEFAQRTAVLKLGRLIAEVPRGAADARGELLEHLAP
jgi:ABC-type branched-subunit amino acid transport system ATPase component